MRGLFSRGLSDPQPGPGSLLLSPVNTQEQAKERKSRLGHWDYKLAWILPAGP